MSDMQSPGDISLGAAQLGARWQSHKWECRVLKAKCSMAGCCSYRYLPHLANQRWHEHKLDIQMDRWHAAQLLPPDADGAVPAMTATIAAIAGQLLPIICNQTNRTLPLRPCASTQPFFCI